MTIVSTDKDVDNLRLIVIAEFDAAPEKVWRVWEVPRMLERWWGPPTYPATFTRHDFAVGGESRYYMTGPNGESPKGWWRINAIDKPRRLDFLNGLAGADGEPVEGVDPMPSYVTFEAAGGGTRMTTTTQFVSVDQMEKMIGLGMQEGMKQAMGQIDGVLSLIADPSGTE